MRRDSVAFSIMIVPLDFNVIRSLIASELDSLRRERQKSIVASTVGGKEVGWGVRGAFIVDGNGFESGCCGYAMRRRYWALRCAGMNDG